MLVLERKGSEVFCNGQKLTIVAQATKGPGKEVVKVAGLEGSNGQKWVSLSKLAEGLNEIECQGREVASSQKYTLTQEEKARVTELQAEIDSIIAQAKARYVAKPNMNRDISKMSNSEKLEFASQLEAYVASLKAQGL